MDMQEFFNPIKTDEVHVAVSQRFKDTDGQLIKWVLSPITTELDEQLRKECTKKEPVGVEGKRYTSQLDIEKYISALAVETVKYPNLRNVGLQENYGAFGGEMLLKKMLLPGEYAGLTDEVTKINGFDSTLEELIKQAKN